MKKLTRSSKDKMISGVLGGIAEFFGIGSTGLRIGYVFIAFVTSYPLILLYILASIIIPQDDGFIYQENNEEQYKNNSNTLLGISLIILGIILVLKITLEKYNFRIIQLINNFLREIVSFWPISLIILGIYIIIKSRDNE